MESSNTKNLLMATAVVAVAFAPSWAAADEHLFGYVKGAETLPKGNWELYQWITSRADKDSGSYRAWNTSTEIERGVTDRLNVAGYFRMQRIDTSGLVIDGYLPGAESYGLRPSGVEGEIKYNFRSPAIENVGLSAVFALTYDWRDPHSGRDKDTTSIESTLIAQKYFREGQLVWAANVGLEATHADRAPIEDLPDEFEWPTDPEMEIELIGGSAFSYRFQPNWHVGVETLYETEFETEVGQERWSLFAGPVLHYATQKWWLTFSWMSQQRGGGEQYTDQPDADLHLIEKTKDEYRLKIGLNF